MANEYTTSAKKRVTTIRVRAWGITLAIIVALIFYFLVTVTTRNAINWIDFALLATVQIICHCVYFPEGDLFGQKDAAYISNKEIYNRKANEINEKRNIAKLREYCKQEYLERKQRYIDGECGAIGITTAELEILKQKTEKEIRQMKSFEVREVVDYEERSKLIIFSRYKRRKLYKLIFHEIPVEENYPETIMSAVETNGNHAIRDGSVTYKAHAYIRKILQATVVGAIFAYIGYAARDGVGIAQIVQIIMYITSMLTTSVISFANGEACSKVHKSKFYMELATFIDGFNEWLPTVHSVESITSLTKESE